VAVAVGGGSQDERRVAAVQLVSEMESSRSSLDPYLKHAWMPRGAHGLLDAQSVFSGKDTSSPRNATRIGTRVHKFNPKAVLGQTSNKFAKAQTPTHPNDLSTN
jgi:hypothetical protein